MATILLFHSVLGLRDAEAALAARFRAAGHEVVLPDLYGGQRSNDYDRGFAIRDRVGWGTMIARAQAAAAPLPPETVLAGVSLGAQVAGEVWASRPETAGVLLLHGPCENPARCARRPAGAGPSRRTGAVRRRELHRRLGRGRAGAPGWLSSSSAIRAPATISPMPACPITTPPRRGSP